VSYPKEYSSSLLEMPILFVCNDDVWADVCWDNIKDARRTPTLKYIG